MNPPTPTTETGIVEPKAWIDESGTLRAPEGYAFESIDLPGFDASGYPRKGVRLAPLMGFTPRAAIAAMPDSTQLLQTAWRPIETAPKDGTYVLAYFGETAGDDPSDMCVCCFFNGKWVDDQQDDLGALDTPTHWMPLPEPLAQFRAQAQRS